MRIRLFLLICGLAAFESNAQNLQLGLLVYNGGGDWYANPSALKNLASFSNAQIGTHFSTTQAEVEVGSPNIFNFPFVHMTGHGRVDFSSSEAANLREYLIAGGFLHVDDNYGLDKWLRPAMKKVFPELSFVEIPASHPIYHCQFDFAQGLPKIHEHEGKAPKGYGLLYKGRLVCFYSFESDLGDGWEDPEVHNDSPAVRETALKMGVNLIKYALSY